MLQILTNPIAPYSFFLGLWLAVLLMMLASIWNLISVGLWRSRYRTFFVLILIGIWGFGSVLWVLERKTPSLTLIDLIGISGFWGLFYLLGKVR
jgi:hypothetical protein